MKKYLAVFCLLVIASTVWILQSSRELNLPESNEQAKKSAQKSKTIKSHRSGQKDFIEDDSHIINELIYKVLDKKQSVLTRTKDVLALRKIKLSTADENALIDHIKTPQEDEVYSVKNDIIEHLVRYGSDKEKVGEALLHIMGNDNQSRVMREYVLQYVPEYYLSRWIPDSQWNEFEERDRQKFNDIMWYMTDLTEGSMAGGALFALYRISDKYEDVNKGKVFEKSHDILVDPSYMNPNRMGAVQILAFSNNEEYYNTARQIVLEKQGPVLLQVTAIHTAVQSKNFNPEFISYLKELAKSDSKSDPTLKRCAQLTLKKIKRF